MRALPFVPLFLIACASSSSPRPVQPAPDFHVASPDRLEVLGGGVSDGDGAIHPIDVVLFEFDSHQLDEADRLQVDAVARWLRNHPEVRLVLEGYADATGPDHYNTNLAARRAHAIRGRLIGAGVPEHRIVVGVYGEHLPIAESDANNRRVRIYAEPMQRPVRIGQVR